MISLKNISAQTTSPCTNLPISAVKASGSQSGNPPQNAIDNNPNTRWSHLGIGQWIQTDLGVQKVICSVDITWAFGNERQNNFVISISSDGANFNNIFTGRSSGTTLSPEKYDILDVNARYVKITVNGNTQNNWASITEIDVYGRNPPSQPPPPVNANDKSYDVNVLVIKYFPLTTDGTVDINITGEQSLAGVKYETIRQKTIDIINGLPSILGKATTYLGYKDSSAKPGLVYHINDTIEYKKPVPIAPRPDNPVYPDYNWIMRAHDICNYIDNKNIKEIWIWAYQGHPVTKLGMQESKMSGPFGDISNSNRANDMPPCKNTYVVYTFNYARGTAEAIENWGHQVEVELTAVDKDISRPEGDLFRNLFQGPNHPQEENVNGRCGDVHNPPNARFEYDRSNSIPQLSDCLDWNPDSLGILSQISCKNWGCVERSDSDNPPLNYMVWNWQNLPGINNTKTYQDQQLRNWWDIYGDFDNVMANSKKLTR